jgi:hypothetical protein
MNGTLKDLRNALTVNFLFESVIFFYIKEIPELLLDLIKIDKEHPSVMKISENNTINNELNFKHVSEEFVTKQINKLCSLSILIDLSPISLATLMKNLLTFFETSCWSFTMLSFSHKTMLLFEFFVLPDKNGFIVG